MSPVYLAGGIQPAQPITRSGSISSAHLVAVLVAAIIGSRFMIYTQMSVGYIASLALTPVWLPLMLRARAARWLLGAAAVALMFGFTLSFWSSRDHEVSWLQAGILAIEMVGVVASAGCLYWVARTITVPPTLVAYGLGMLAFVNNNSDHFGISPWRFGYALPVTIVALGVATWTQRWWIEAVTLIVLCAASLATGARSAFAIQALALLMLWIFHAQLRRGTKRAPLKTLSMVALFSLAVYNLTQAFNLEGLLGEDAQVRTQAQLDAAGNLLLGGRPEIGATMALMVKTPLGFGLGILPNWSDIQAARAGMWAIGYDPMNGYVDNYMFGGAFRVHSIVGGLWITFGVAGILLATVLIATAIAGIAAGPRIKMGDGLTLVVCTQMLWNSFFSPWYASIASMVIMLPLVWVRLDEAKTQRDGLPGRQ